MPEWISSFSQRPHQTNPSHPNPSLASADDLCAPYRVGVSRVAVDPRSRNGTVHSLPFPRAGKLCTVGSDRVIRSRPARGLYPNVLRVWWMFVGCLCAFWGRVPSRDLMVWDVRAGVWSQ
eukprot:5194134-Pyramimonas_sp.AAC.1